MTDEELARIMAQFEARGGYNPQAPVFNALCECALCRRAFDETVRPAALGGVLVDGYRFIAGHCRSCKERLWWASNAERAELFRTVEDNLLSRLSSLTAK